MFAIKTAIAAATKQFSTKISPQIVSQSPNMAETWSKSQMPKKLATTGARFEQTNWELQPNPLSAQELIAKVPITFVQNGKVSCDGGGGALGHPKENHQAMACGYCGLRFQKKEHSH